MFLLASAAFSLFTLFYGLMSGAVIYHLKQYTLPGSSLPKIVVTLFIFFSIFFWLLAFIFLIKIRGLV